MALYISLLYLWIVFLIMYNNILVPYDGSKPADNALEHAVKLAKLVIMGGGDCKLSIIHVIQDIPSTALFLERPIHTKDGQVIPMSEYILQLYDQMRTQVTDMLEKKKKEVNDLYEKIAVKPIVLIGGSVPNRIIEYAEENKTDLIVIGNVGLSGISKIKMLGSVSRKVSEQSPCPVLIIH